MLTLKRAGVAVLFAAAVLVPWAASASLQRISGQHQPDGAVLASPMPCFNRHSVSLSALTINQLVQQFHGVSEILNVDALPDDIRRGTFERPAGSVLVGTWALAEPGAAFQESDLGGPDHLPLRRIEFAACRAKLCLLAYDLGGIVEGEHFVVFSESASRWTMIWHAYLNRLPRIDSLKQFLNDLRSGSDVIEYGDPCEYGF